MLDLFDEYFLILVLVHAGLAVFIDSRNFKKEKLFKFVMKTRIIGISAMIISVILFSLSKIL